MQNGAVSHSWETAPHPNGRCCGSPARTREPRSPVDHGACSNAATSHHYGLALPIRVAAFLHLGRSRSPSAPRRPAWDCFPDIRSCCFVRVGKFPYSCMRSTALQPSTSYHGDHPLRDFDQEVVLSRRVGRVPRHDLVQSLASRVLFHVSSQERVAHATRLVRVLGALRVR
jgi:hypothetical protein